MNISDLQMKDPLEWTDGELMMYLIQCIEEEGFDLTSDQVVRYVGMAFVGRLLGWRAMRLTFAKKTISKFEHFIGPDLFVTQLWPQYGPYFHMSSALSEFQESGMKDFWRCVSLGKFEKRIRG